MTVTLRSARSTDAGKVGAILTAFAAETAWMPRLHSAAEDVQFAGKMIDRGWVTVAETPQGVAAFSAHNAAEVHALYVASGHRRQGLGSALLRAMQATAPRLEVWTFQANAPAQRFYTRHGFVETTRTDGRDTDEQLPDIRYVWPAGETA